MPEKKIKVAVTAEAPSLGARMDMRFGRCAYFVIVNTEDMSIETLENSAGGGGGAGIQAAKRLADKGVQAVLTGNLGPNAHETLTAAGIEAVVGCKGTVSEAVTQFQSGALNPATGPNVESHSGMRSAR